MKIRSLFTAPKRLASCIRSSERLLREILAQNELQYRDLMDVSSGAKQLRHNDEIILQTDHPVAYDSPDHISPLGTLQDNTRHYPFYRKCVQLYGESLTYLDLGCSGGGLVFECALNGHLAIGLEGSDHSQKAGRANWRTIPKNLMTCDITKPFSLVQRPSGQTQLFHVISAWEVFEHIERAALPALLANIAAHLQPNGLLVGSISHDSKDPLHVSIMAEAEWKALFAQHGFSISAGYEDAFEFGEFCRGIGGGMQDGHNYRTHPEKGFHFVARRIAHS